MATIHDFARMCNYYEHCADCSFNSNGYDCDNYLALYPDEATKTIDKWIAEHPIPIKTYASNFYDKFPNASRTVWGYPDICLKSAYGGDCSCDTCEECWNREYKGE